MGCYARIWNAVRRYATNYPDMEPADAAELIVAGFGRAEMRAAAQLWAADQYEAAERQRVRQIEREAWRDEVDAREQAHAGLSKAEIERREKAARWEEYLRGERVAAGLEPPRDEADLRRCQAQARRGEQTMARSEAKQARRARIIAAAVAEARVQWTAELLAASFALGDGTRTSWGSATVEQHEQRMQMLTRGIVGNIETLNRHEAAVERIMQSGGRTLAEALGWDTADSGALMAVSA